MARDTAAHTLVSLLEEVLAALVLQDSCGGSYRVARSGLWMASVGGVRVEQPQPLLTLLGSLCCPSSLWFTGRPEGPVPVYVSDCLAGYALGWAHVGRVGLGSC